MNLKMTQIFFALIFFLLIFSNSNAQEILWQNTIGGASFDWLRDAAVTSDGGYIFVGNSDSDSSGDKTENQIGNLVNAPDYWIVKTDSLGNIQWQNTIGGDVNDSPYAVIQTNDGGYLVGGFSNSDSSFDKSENNVCGGGFDYWVVKLNNFGVIQWDNSIGGLNGQSYLTDIKQALDGGFIIGGYSEANICGDKTENSIGGFDYWILKLNNVGDIIWENTIGGNQNDLLQSIDLTSDGGYILGGTSASSISGDKTEDSVNDDYWIVKIDSTGNILWQNTIGGSINDRLVSIQQIHNGGYILGGNSTSDISGDKTEICFGSFDYWILETDSVGNIVWQETIGGSSIDQLSSIQQTLDHGFILGGVSESNTSGDKTENSWATDYWVVKIDSVGVIEWQNTIGAYEDEWLGMVKESSNGTYIIAGHSGSVGATGDKTEANIGYMNYWVMKLCTNSFNYINVNSCDSLVSPSGIHTYYSTGIYTDTLINFNGCDSIITINLTIIPTPIVSVFSQGPLSFCLGDSLILSATLGLINYQWYNRNYLIPGAISENYTAKNGGRFKCIAQNALSCADTSNIIVVNVPCIPIGPNQERGIANTEYENYSVQIYPNPGTGIFSIHSPPGQLQVFDFTGKMILSMELYEELSNFDLSGYSDGIYFLIHRSGAEISSKKLILSHY